MIDVGVLENASATFSTSRAAPDGCPATAEGRDRELSRRDRSRSWTRSTTPKTSVAGTRKVPFGRELYIERDDFMENPPKKFFRLSPGNEVRLRYAYFINATRRSRTRPARSSSCAAPTIPATKGGNAPDGRKVKATMHWLPAAQAIPAEIRIYNQLFAKPNPDASNFAVDLNPESLEILQDARIEPSIAASNSHAPMQFERQGYFTRDPDSTAERLVFNRTIGLRDTFAKEVGAKG